MGRRSRGRSAAGLALAGLLWTVGCTNREATCRDGRTRRLRHLDACVSALERRISQWEDLHARSRSAWSANTARELQAHYARALVDARAALAAARTGDERATQERTRAAANGSMAEAACTAADQADGTVRIWCAAP
jgi:hypothetical protein